MTDYDHRKLRPLIWERLSPEERRAHFAVQDAGYSLGRYILDDVGGPQRVGWVIQRPYGSMGRDDVRAVVEDVGDVMSWVARQEEAKP